MTLTKEGEGKVAISGADNLGAVVAGSKLTVTATPSDGWELKNITANGKDITADKRFVVTSNTVVKVVFKRLPPKTYAVTLTKEGEGKVAISGADNLGAVVAGSKLTVTATPADGWAVCSITANGKDITTAKSFVVTSDTNVKVVFKKLPPKTYAVTLTKEGEGKVAISGADNLDAVVTGSKLTVTATPADGWAVSSITANGKDITTNKTFVVTSNTVVKVVFKKLPPKTYAVTLTKEGDGKVAISGANNLGAVVTGSKLTVTAAPADGWEVKSITANGKDITADKSFVVTSNTVVKVVFKKLPPKTYAVTLTKEGEGDASILVVFPNGDKKELEVGKAIFVPASTKLTVKVYFNSMYWYVASMTANGVDILASRSFVVTQDTALKVVSAPTLSTKVFMDGRGKVSVTVHDGRKKVYTLQDKPDQPDNAQYILSSIGALKPDTKLAVTATPADGWELIGITANGADILSSKTFNVMKDSELRVFFRKKAPSPDDDDYVPVVPPTSSLSLSASK